MRMLLDSTPENDIAERLRLWRKTALELTQKEFAEATGVHLSAIRKYENRNSVPSSESLLAIASTGIDLHWLLTGEGDMRALAKRLGSAANTDCLLYTSLDPGFESLRLRQLQHLSP